jgi:magnesium-transporting ATPase (P-type)
MMCINEPTNVQPIYDSFFLTFYNIFFTSWPILIFGLLEQNFTSRQLLDNLHLYRDIANNARMSWLQFFKWVLLGKIYISVHYFKISVFTPCLMAYIVCSIRFMACGSNILRKCSVMAARSTFPLRWPHLRFLEFRYFDIS